MDTNVAGLNKVYCFTTNSNYNGKAVSITDGVNVWIETLSELSCVFMIPSIPAPAKKRYTVTLHNGDETAAALYTRVIDLGFGDSIRIGLYTTDEVADKAYVQSWVSSHAYSLPTASGATKGGITVSDSTSNGLYMSGTGLYLRTASTTQKGGIKVGQSLQIDSGTGVLNKKVSLNNIVTTVQQDALIAYDYSSDTNIRVNYTSTFTKDLCKVIDPKYMVFDIVPSNNSYTIIAKACIMVINSSNSTYAEIRILGGPYRPSGSGDTGHVVVNSQVRIYYCG